MEIASVSLARSIWLFETAELNPRGINIYPGLLTKLVDRYKFKTFPMPDDLLSFKDRRFSAGQFLFGETSVEVGLEWWQDGLVGDTKHSTRVADAFLEDFLQWLGGELQVQFPADLVKNKGYRSELVVYASKSLRGFCAKLDSFSDELSEVWSDRQELSNIVFGSEAKTAAFTFERRVKTEYAQNKFFSTALTDTARHLTLLQRFEEILAG